MRKLTLLGLLGLLGICGSAMAAAVAVDDRPVAVEKSSVSRVAGDDVGPGDDLASPDEAPGVSPDVIPVLLDPDMVFEHVVREADGSLRLGDGGEGAVAGDTERLIYQNVLGIHAINFPNNQPVSDDISTTAPDGCNLTRYKFKVLGKVLDPSPSPPPTTGPYTVHYGLYTNCPLAVGSTNAARDLVRIPGTEGTITFDDDAPRTIEHVVPFLTPVALPSNVYLGIRFTRSNCGTVLGAPAMIGFSGDRYDFPGFPCNGFLGGFPQLPHASFWLEMYGTTNCPDAFAAYKCQKPSGSPATYGAGTQGVDDVKLIVDNCNMIGYEVVVKGVAAYTFDLRRECDSQIIPGTERTFQVNASTTPLLQVARFTFNPPILLTTDSLYLGFKASSNSAGAIVAGIEPIIGSSEVDLFTVGLEGCDPIIPTQGVHGAINLAITCSGLQPQGACCDPHLTECNAGPDVGKRCACNATCQGGPNQGACCVSAANCGAPGICQPFCAAPGTCESVCRQTTEINCPFPPRGQEQRPKWQEGADCIAVCEGGSNDGDVCLLDSECPGGNCPQPFPEACGEAACCHIRINPNTQLEEEVCVNLTKNECNAVPPLDKARLWQLGDYCGLAAQRCPRNACLARQGSCYVEHNSRGCDDPFCCEDICLLGQSGAFCCNTAWDSACVALAEIHCQQEPPHDQCAPDFPKRGLAGALAIPFPGSRASSNLKATESVIDAGFCCHGGVGTCLTGSQVGQFCVTNADCAGGTCSEFDPDPGLTGLGSLWFKWVQGTGTTANVSTCTSNSPALDSLLQVYRVGDNSTGLTACNSLSVIGCADDTTGCGSLGRNSRVCLRNLTPGATYYILLAAKTDNRRGQYIVTLSSSGCGPNADPIINDYCHRATSITDATPADPLVVPFSFTHACSGGANAGKPCTVAANCPNSSCVPASATFECPAAFCSPSAQNDIWYNYTATCSGEATFSTCGAGSPDTNLAVYEDCTKCPPYSGDPIGCNEDFFQQSCGVSARVTVNVTQGQCYKVRLADNDGAAVSGNLTITCTSGDCNNNGIPDPTDIANCPPGTGPASCQDCNNNGRPDVCDIPPDSDCQPNGIPDLCELDGNDCQPDGIPDDCGGTIGGNCPTGPCVTSVPANCAIDALRPFPPNTPGTPQGWNSMAMTFSGSCTIAGAVPGDFTVACNPVGAPCPTVIAANAVGQVATVTLSTVIPAQKWTCVTHTPSGQEVCLGKLPGDVNGNRTSQPADITPLIDNLNGTLVPPLAMNHCDLDRSGACQPPDILVVINLLNGSDQYGVWNARTLPLCPSTACGNGLCEPVGGENQTNCLADCAPP